MKSLQTKTFRLVYPGQIFSSEGLQNVMPQSFLLMSRRFTIRHGSIQKSRYSITVNILREMIFAFF